MPTEGQKALAARQSKPDKTVKMAEAKKGMGFDKAAQSIAKKQGISIERARAIVAQGARKASPAAKRANPNLKKVKGKAK